jgi:uncharacterized protein YhaN
LYSLPIGIDRVSLAQVMRELSASRRHWLGKSEVDGHIGRLLAERSRLLSEIDALADGTMHYAHLAGEREDLGRQSQSLEQQLESLKDELQRLDMALAVRDKWAERARLDAQLAPLATGIDLPADVMDRFEAIQAGIARHKTRWQKMRLARRKLRTEARQLRPQRKLLEQAGRIHAMAEQQEWVTGLERKVASLTTEHRELERELESQTASAGLAGVPVDLLKRVDVRSLAPLKAQARELQKRRAARDQALGQSDVPSAPIAPAAHNGEEKSELIAAAQAAGEKVSLLRRRVQVNQRLEQMAVQQQELEEQSGELADRQLLPLPIVMILGTVFVLGVVLVLAGWWLKFGWLVAVLGAAAIIGSVVMKYYLERSADQQLDHCDRQLATLRQQMEQLKQQRKQLDAEIPPGGGPLLARLEAAEAELARLEGLLPVDAERKEAHRPAVATVDHQQAEKAYQEELRRWRQMLHAAGWPAKMTPKQVWQAARRSRQLPALVRRRDQLQADLDLAQTALTSFTQRVRQLLADVELLPASELPGDLIRQLRQGLTQQESLQAQRRELARRDARHRRRQQQERRRASRLARERVRLERKSGAIDEADLRRRVTEQSLRANLLAARDAVEREIAITLGRQYTEEAVRLILEGSDAAALDARRQQSHEQLQRAQNVLRETLERRGLVLNQMQQLAEDRRLGQLQLELAEVEARLGQAVERWKTLVVASQTIESVRRRYERERQPEALKEASVWLERLTNGRYTRVWTPLGEDRLWIDDADGHSWHAGDLSRGTREQLFLALRLALVASYARRGIRLPMVLDDVLVNFDADRARAAASVLVEFGAQGQQLLVFTCHEHLATLFDDLGVPVRQLPSRSGEAVQPLPASKKKPASRRKRNTEPAPVMETEAVAEPVVDERLPIAEPLTETPYVPLSNVIVEIAAVESVAPPMVYEVAPPQVAMPPAATLVPETTAPPASQSRRPARRPRRDPREAMFGECDGLFPWNEEPDETVHLGSDEPEVEPQPWSEPRLATPDLVLEEAWPGMEQPIEGEWLTAAEPWHEGEQKSVWIGGHWLGEGAEEFDGEFAVRPEPKHNPTSEPLLGDSPRRRRRAKRSTKDNDAEAA